MLSILRNHQKGCVIAQLIVALKKVFTFTYDFDVKKTQKCQFQVFYTIGSTDNRANQSFQCQILQTVYCLLSKVNFKDLIKGQQLFTVIQIARRDQAF